MPPRRTRSLRAAWFLVIPVAVTVGCGGGSDVSLDAASTTEPVPDAVISMSEWRFGPADVRLQGDEVSLQLRNEGSILHEWALLSRPVESEADLSDDLYVARLAVPAGQVGMVTFTLPAPGVYQVVCPIPGHIASGMVGSLTVDG